MTCRKRGEISLYQRKMRPNIYIYLDKNGNKQKHRNITTYNTRDSLVVTDPTTNPAVSGLTRGERTGSRVLQILWSYVLELYIIVLYIGIDVAYSLEVIFEFVDTESFIAPQISR